MPFQSLTPANAQTPRRLLLALSGTEKSGKTHFALATAPEPVYHFVLDPNGLAIAQKLVREVRQNGTVTLPPRDIRVARYNYDLEDSATSCAAIWTSLRADLREALKANRGSIVIDSGTEMWELLRVSRLGKTDGVMPRYYGPLNAEMRAIFNDIQSSDMSCIVTQKMKDEYKADKATGNAIPAGWGDMPYTMQANARAVYDPALAASLGSAHPFLIYIENCALNYTLAQQWYPTDWFTFETWLGMLDQ